MKVKGVVVPITVVAFIVALVFGIPRYQLWKRFNSMPAEPVATNDWFGSYELVSNQPAVIPPEAAPSQRTISARALEQAADYAKAMESYGLIIAHRGKIQLETYDEAFDETKTYDSQSMHKPLVPLLIGTAIDDGLIDSVNDPIEKYLPKWKGDPRGLITVRDLLYMESGLRQPVVGTSLRDDGTEAFVSSDIAKFIYALDSERPPGKAFNFNYISTQLLSMVLESASGKRYAEYLGERLWSRIDAGPATVRLDRAGGNAHTFCCINATPRGWHQVGALIMNDGRYNDQKIISSDWLAKMKTSSRATNMGMLIWMATPQTGFREYSETRKVRTKIPVSAPYLADDLLFFEGRGGQRIYVSASRQLVVVRVGKVSMAWDDAKFINYILSGLMSPDAPVVENPAPDYQQLSSWATFAKNKAENESQMSKPAAAFYIHPSTYRDEFRWNASVDDVQTNKMTDAVIAGQATVFLNCCDVYAPRYRQASLKSVFDQTGNGAQAYDVAYGDVRRAFNVFIESIGDKPFFIAGHSQGGFHAKRLLAEISLDKDLKDRLVAGYVVGIGIPNALYRSDFRELKPCLVPDETGCVASWNSYTPDGAQQQFVDRTLHTFAREVAWSGDKSIQCTNPVDFNGGSRADASDKDIVAVADLRDLFNPAAPAVDPLTLPLMSGLDGITEVACKNGVVTVAGELPAQLQPMLFPGGVLHLADYALFHKAISENASLRSQKFIQGK